MKKVLLFLLICILVISCFACSGKEQPFTVYLKTAENMKSIKGMDAQMSSKITMTAAGQNISMTIDGHILQVKRSDTDIDLMMDLSMSAPALNVNNAKTEAYYTGGYYYVNAGGAKIKTPMDIQKMEAQSNVNLLNFDTSMIKSSTTANQSGNTVLTFVLDGTKAMTLVNQLSSSYLNNISGGTTNTNISAGDITCELIVNNKYMPVSEKLSFKISTQVSGQTISMDLNMTITYNRFDNNITISFPDLSGYTETSIKQ